MTHQELEHLASEYLEGSLDAVRQAQAAAHLAECASCREMIADLERVISLCHETEDLEAPPWMVQRILLATVGERKPSLRERLSSFLRPTFQPRLVYGLAMAVFSMSVIFHAAGLSVREITLADLNPTNWVKGVDRTGHLLVARAEKFYYDLRVVYEIESRLKQLRGQPNQPATPPGQERPKSQPAPGGTTDSKPEGPPVLAQGVAVDRAAYFPVLENVGLTEAPGPVVKPGRSSIR